MVQWTHRKDDNRKDDTEKIPLTEEEVYNRFRPVWPETTEDILQDTRKHNNSLQEEAEKEDNFLTTLLDKEAAAKEAASKKRGVENVVVEEEEGDKGDVGTEENSWWAPPHVSTREDDILYSQQRNRTNALASGAMHQSDELVHDLAEITLKYRTSDSQTVAAILKEISEQWGMEQKHVLTLMVTKQPITNDFNERRFLKLWKKEVDADNQQRRLAQENQRKKDQENRRQARNHFGESTETPRRFQ